MLKPTYKVKIGSETFELDAQSPLVSIRVNQDIDIPADSFEIVFGVSDKTTKIKEGRSRIKLFSQVFQYVHCA